MGQLIILLVLFSLCQTGHLPTIIIVIQLFKTATTLVADNQYENSHWNNTNSFQGPRHAGQGFYSNFRVKQEFSGFPGGRHYGESLSNFQPNQLILRPTQGKLD